MFINEKKVDEKIKELEDRVFGKSAEKNTLSWLWLPLFSREESLLERIKRIERDQELILKHLGVVAKHEDSWKLVKIAKSK